jgi:cytochrome c-type biogenesis protein
MTAEGGLSTSLWRRVVLASLLFVLGFSTVFVSLGASASMVGQLIQTYRGELAMAAGVVIILFGLHFLGLLRIPLLYSEARYHAENSSASLAGAYVMGLAFAFGWTPCIGPILATVLALAANEQSLGAGVRLLAVYSLGLGVPFVLAAVAIRPFLSFMQRFKRHLGTFEKVMGLVLVLTGLAFLNIVDWFNINALGQWLIETFPSLGNVEDWVTPDSLPEEIRRQGGGK